MSDQNGGASSTTTSQTPTLPAELSRFLVQRDGAYFMRQVLDGVETLVPLDLAQAGLQKLNTADKRLKEASEQAKRHKTAIEFYDSTVKGLNGDEDSARHALSLVGLDDEPEPAPRARQSGHQRSQPVSQSTTATIPPELSRVAKFLDQVNAMGVDPVDAVRLVLGNAQQAVENNVYREVGNLASQNPVLAKVLQNPKHARYVVAELNGLVRDRIRNGEPDGPQTYLPAIQEVAAKYKELGIGGNPAPKSVATDSNGEALLGSYMGLGPASSSGSGETGLLDVSAKRPDPTTPIRAKAGEYGLNLAARLKHDLAQSAMAAQEAATGEASL